MYQKVCQLIINIKIINETFNFFKSLTSDVHFILTAYLNLDWPQSWCSITHMAFGYHFRWHRSRTSSSHNYYKFLIWLLSTFSNPVENHLLRVLDIPKSFIPQCRLLPKMPFPNLWAASIFKLFIPLRKYHLLKKRSCWGQYTTRSPPEISIIVPGLLLSQHLYHSHSAQFSYSVMSNSVWPPWTAAQQA